MMNGVVCINKKSGMTSSDVVVKVRNALTKACGEKQKAGHFGTLDPEGMGVLVIGIGASTRLFDYTLNKKKVYRAAFVFGAETDTLDASGKIANECNFFPDEAEIKNALGKMIGKQMQMPPKYSALSVGGVKAYKLARQGKEVDLAPRPIEIYDIKLTEKINDREYEFLITCSSGTYIRSVARDLANVLGTLGYMKYIIRETSGTVKLSDCVTLDEFLVSPQKYVQSNEIVLKDYPHYDLKDKKSEDKVLNGVKVAIKDLPNDDFVLTINNVNVAIAENINGYLKIKTRLI